MGTTSPGSYTTTRSIAARNQRRGERNPYFYQTRTAGNRGSIKISRDNRHKD